ncbi:Endoplasmic reticulum chaperone BiP, partial [Linum perenne]
KRLIGKKFDDTEVQNDIKYLPYPVVNIDGKPHLELVDEVTKTFNVEEMSAMVLGKMKETVESYVGKPVTGAVVTVPAYLNDAQRKATKDAAKIIGLNVLQIINEPTAGALAYSLNKRKILVYDLGGGTFDVSVMEIENYVFRVLATGGDTHLGGGDFDHAVMQHFIEFTKKKYNKDVRGDSKALGMLRDERCNACSQITTKLEAKQIVFHVSSNNCLFKCKSRLFRFTHVVRGVSSTTSILEMQVN